MGGLALKFLSAYADDGWASNYWNGGTTAHWYGLDFAGGNTIVSGNHTKTTDDDWEIGREVRTTVTGLEDGVYEVYVLSGDGGGYDETILADIETATQTSATTKHDIAAADVSIPTTDWQGNPGFPFALNYLGTTTGTDFNVLVAPTTDGSAGRNDCVWMGVAYTRLKGGIIITESQGSTEVEEGRTTDSYEIVLISEPNSDVLITAMPEAGDVNLDLGAGAGQPVVLSFTPSNWAVPQTVTVAVVDDEDRLDEPPFSFMVVSIAHDCQSSDENNNRLTLPRVEVTVIDDDQACGAIGYYQSDINRDCHVNLLDYALLAEMWLRE